MGSVRRRGGCHYAAAFSSRAVPCAGTSSPWSALTPEEAALRLHAFSKVTKSDVKHRHGRMQSSTDLRCIKWLFASGLLLDYELFFAMPVRVLRRYSACYVKFADQLLVIINLIHDSSIRQALPLCMLSVYAGNADTYSAGCRRVSFHGRSPTPAGHRHLPQSVPVGRMPTQRRCWFATLRASSQAI